MRITSELNDLIRNDVKSFGESREMIMVQTGFDCFDYLNGQILLNSDGSQTKNIGVDGGKLITVIGKSGSGKTTFAIQMGANIARRYDESSMYFLDFEQGTSEERIRMVTGMSTDEFNDKVILKQSGIGTETVLRLVLQVAKFKQAHKKELLVPNKEGIIGEDGKPKMILPPTVIIVDSIAAMQPLDINDDEEIKGQMTATTTAKLNTQLFKRIGMPCADSNIIVIFVNHINKKIETNIIPTQSQVNYLSQDETLPLQFCFN